MPRWPDGLSGRRRLGWRLGVGGLLRAQLRARWGRALAIGLGVVTSSTAFTVLTTDSEVERLELRGQITEEQSPYHILVRPAGSRGELETEEGLVRPYQLSGQFGGISLEDYATVRDLVGVDVAAPVAMVGYVMSATTLHLDVGPMPAGAERELLVADVVYTADDGLTRVDRPAASFSYTTTLPTRFVGQFGDDTQPYGLAEVQPDGSRALVCPRRQPSAGPARDPHLAARERNISCSSVQPETDAMGPGAMQGQHGIALEWAFPLLVAAVDPVQEARLAAGNPSGAWLSALGDAPVGDGNQRIPVVVADDPGVDTEAEVTVRRLPDRTADRFAGGLSLDEVDDVLTPPSGSVVAERTITAQQAYDALVDDVRARLASVVVDSLWTTSATTYDVGEDGKLLPRPVATDPEVWRSPLRTAGYVPVPPITGDVGFREVQAHPGSARGVGNGRLPQLQIVDTVRPEDADATEFDGAHGLAPAGERARGLLGNESLMPSGALSDYQLGPPAAFMRLSDLDAFASAGVELAEPGAPISAIRVRVDGVTGVGDVDRERVRLVADEIRTRTGLDVDVVLGGSLTPQTVVLPEGEFGRPELALTETWVRKGVVPAVLTAVDRKSVALFTLVLAVCGLYVANVTAASTRSRRTELAVLGRVGWRRGMVLRLLLAEAGLVGVAAGLVGAALSMVAGVVLGFDVAPWRALMAVPVAVGMALAAAAWPAWRASRSDLVPVRRPAERPDQRGHWLRPVGGVGTLTVANLLRLPGRTSVGVLAVALGCAALTVVLGVSFAFDGAVAGSALGEAVSLRAREIDFAAAVITVALASAGVADVVYLNMRDRRAELAVLQAVGWDAAAVRRLVVGEAAVIGTVGSLLGATVGFVGVAALAGRIPAGLVVAAAATVAGGVALPMLASVIPAAVLRRLTVARILTRDA